MSNRIISWFSCGAASAVATKLAISDYENVNIVYCEVIEEHPDNKRFLNDCEDWFGQKITVLGNDKYNRSIYEVFEKTRYLSGHAGARCTVELKKSIRKDYEEPGDIQVFGYTVEEQRRVDRFIDANNYVELITPLIDRGLTKSDCLAMIEDAGIEIPAMYKLGYNNNNPCTLDTEVITDLGIYKIGELIGNDIKIFNRSGWCDAFVTYMGVQPLIKLSVSRKGLKPRVLKFTPDHRWYQVSRKGHLNDISTEQIKVGDFLPMITNNALLHKTSEEWFTRGFCVGDGSQDHRCKSSNIRIFGNKKTAFDNAGIKYRTRDDGVGYIGKLPYDYKTKFPNIANTQDEKISFLAGWLAADGSCNKLSSICISTSDHKDELLKLLSLLAISPTRIEDRFKTEGFNENKSGVQIINTKVNFVVYFRSSIDLLYKEEHKDNHKETKERLRGWRVDFIEHIKPCDVACVTVENGDPEWMMPAGIVTGNCRGCVKAESPAYWKKIQIDFPEYFEAMSNQEKRLNVKICKAMIEGVPDVRMFLDDLPEWIEPKDDTVDIQCGIFCHMAEQEYK